MKLKKNKSQKGFYTIEAIVAIIIVMVGIVGITRVQSYSISTMSDAHYRANASYLADSLIGQMWLDKKNINKYATSGNTEYDNWLNELKSSLPGVADNAPVITITDSGTSKIVNIIIKWKNPSAGVSSNYSVQTYIF